MILPMLPVLWREMAENAAGAKMAFGDRARRAYVGGEAGQCVSDLLKGYFENTLPLLAGPDREPIGPPFFSRPAVRRPAAPLPLSISNLKRAGARAARGAFPTCSRKS